MERRSITDPLATRLFTNPPIAGRSPKIRRNRQESRPNVFSLLCGIAVITAGLFSLPLTATTTDTRGLWDRIKSIINNDVPLFFKDIPYRNDSLSIILNKYNNNNNNDVIITIMGALPLAIIASICVTLLVGVCVYYDSSYPGKSPRTPCTPTPKLRSPYLRQMPSSQLSLGYKMTLGNGIVLGILFLIVFRIYFNLPFLKIGRS